jgi:S1-C subfamily serine protease
VPQDFIEAYKWLNLAAQGDEHFGPNRDNLLRHMTPEQIAEAQRRSAAFVARKEAAPSSSLAFSDEERLLEPPKATGTAFFITDDGCLLTCAHVLADAVRIEVAIGDKRLRARLVGSDTANDVGVLKVTGEFKALPLAASRGVKLGDSIFTIGFPNADIQGIEPKLTRGEINSLAGLKDDPRHFQISAPVQPGNSGGPLVDLSGNVVGLVAARLGDIAALELTGSLPQNVNYALKSSFITAFLETMPEVTAKLKPPRPATERPLSQVADEVKPSVVLVTVY